MKKYKLTVSVPTYNQEKYIEQCLDGFIMQKTNFPFQVIISDDGSSDKTRDILKKYQKKYPDIIKPIFREKNLGPMDNFVETLNSINTEYVALCDGDDFWTDPNKLQKQVDFLDKNKDFNICFHQTKIFFQDGSKEDEIYPHKAKSESTFDDLIKECYIPANTVVYRWQFAKENSLKKIFPKNVVPGDYFIHLYHAKTGKVKFMEEVMSNYRRHNEGMWWLSSQPDKQEEFHLKYGIRYLNFFKALENQFDLPKETFLAQKRYLVYQTAKSYMKNKKWLEIKQLEEENIELFNEYMSTIPLDSTYNNLSGMKKLLYLLLTDRKLLFHKVNNKFERKPVLFKFYKLIKKLKNIIYVFIGLLVGILINLLLFKCFDCNTSLSSIISSVMAMGTSLLMIKFFDVQKLNKKNILLIVVVFVLQLIINIGIFKMI